MFLLLRHLDTNVDKDQCTLELTVRDSHLEHSFVKNEFPNESVISFGSLYMQ